MRNYWTIYHFTLVLLYASADVAGIKFGKTIRNNWTIYYFTLVLVNVVLCTF